nr:iron ABC transporter permease [Turicibacter sp.]
MNKRFTIVSLFLSLLLVVIFFVTLTLGSYKMSIHEVIQTLFLGGSKLQTTTIFDIRLPRICVALVVAVCLSTAGCILQSITRNELAEPGMIGINAGAALAVVLLISSGQKTYYSQIGEASLLIMPIVAVLGSFLSGFFIYHLSYKKGILPMRLILTGIGVNVGINAFISLYQLKMSQGDYNQVLTWTSGSLWGSSWKFFYLILPLSLFFIGLTVYK